MMKNQHECESCSSHTIGIFKELELSDFLEISKSKVTNTYKKGQNLFVQGNPCFGIYCINYGNVKVTQTNEDGKECIIRVATAGDVIGHRSLFTSQFYQATATALEETQVCFFDKSFVLKIVQENPSIAGQLLTKLGNELGAAEKRLSSYHSKDARERLAEFLLILKQSHGEETPHGTKLNIKLSRQEIASTVGTANETLIRFFSELKKEGFIKEIDKTIYIQDEEGLLNFAGIYC